MFGGNLTSYLFFNVVIFYVLQTLVGFGYDGVALFGVYREDQDSQLEGFGTALDAWGGRDLPRALAHTRSL